MIKRFVAQYPGRIESVGSNPAPGTFFSSRANVHSDQYIAYPIFLYRPEIDYWIPNKTVSK